MCARMNNFKQKGMRMLANFFKGGTLLLLSLYWSCTYADINLIDIQGHKTEFTQLKGKWVFINYWASWCEPCLEEIGALNEFYQQQQDKVALFAVNFDDLPLDEQQMLVKQLHIHYPSLQHDPGKALGLESVKGVPATFVFNPEGKFQTVLYGSQTLLSLQKMII